MPKKGRVFISVRDADKKRAASLASQLTRLGYHVVATRGTAQSLREEGVACEIVNKVTEGRPHIVDMIKNGEIQFIINTTEGEQAIADSFTIRRSAVSRKICYTTTLAGGEAVCLALQTGDIGEISSLQNLHRNLDKEQGIHCYGKSAGDR